MFLMYRIIVFCNSVVEMNSSCIDVSNKPKFVQCFLYNVYSYFFSNKEKDNKEQKIWVSFFGKD